MSVTEGWAGGGAGDAVCACYGGGFLLLFGWGEG